MLSSAYVDANLESRERSVMMFHHFCQCCLEMSLAHLWQRRLISGNIATTNFTHVDNKLKTDSAIRWTKLHRILPTRERSSFMIKTFLSYQRSFLLTYLNSINIIFLCCWEQICKPSRGHSFRELRIMCLSDTGKGLSIKSPCHLHLSWIQWQLYLDGEVTDRQKERRLCGSLANISGAWLSLE